MESVCVSPQRECAEHWMLVEEKNVELQTMRKELISAALTSVFPIEVQPLSLDDAGEEGKVTWPLSLSLSLLSPPFLPPVQTTSRTQ